MSDELAAPTGAAEDFTSDLAAFQQVASAFQRLDHLGRVRLLKTIATFFKLDASEIGIRSSASAMALDSPASSPVATFSEDRTPSPKDFLREKRPLTDIDRIVCLAYYLTHYRDTPHFKTVDLSKLNTEAAQIKFSNAAQAVDNATKAGLLVSAVKGAKQLSVYGEEYVRHLPDRAAAKDALANARPRSRRPKRGKSAVNGASEERNTPDE